MVFQISLKILLEFLAVHLNLLLVCSEVSIENGSPVVKLTDGGLLSGSILLSRDGRPFYSFTGIPYANVPGRFEAAKPFKKNWKGIKSAVKPGSICTQKAFNTLGNTFGTEDCLFVNVYVPVLNTTEKSIGLPFLVWIHGGGFMFGDGISGSGPKYFMDEPVTLVTFNYRLGVFGFLSTGDEVIPGNNGLKDQVLLLKYIQKNIKAFGGNSNQITIFGASAGGSSVHYHLLSPLSKHLFHAAIAQGGSALSFWAYQPKPKENAVQLATYLNCSTKAENPPKITSQEILDCLKNLSKEELNEAQFKYKRSWPNNLGSFNFPPVAEVKESKSNIPFLTESPIALVARGEYASKVPLIIGAAEDEGATMYAGVVLQSDELIKELDSDWDRIAPKAFSYAQPVSAIKQKIIFDELRNVYFGTKAVGPETVVNLMNIYTDHFHYPVYNSAKDYARKGNPVYLYQYAMPGPLSIMGMTFGITSYLAKKVAHADEIQYQFDLPFLNGTSVIKPGSNEEKFSKNFVSLWTSFAVDCKPKHSWGNHSNQEWKAISKMELDGVQSLQWYRLEQNPHVIDDPHEQRMRILDRILTDYFAPTSTQE